MAIGVRAGTYPRHAYLRVSGEIQNPNTGQTMETWSWGLRLATPGPGVDGGLSTASPIVPYWDDIGLKMYLEELAVPAIRAFYATALFSPFLRVTRISCNALVDNPAAAAGTKYEFPYSVEVEPGTTEGVNLIKGGSTNTQALRDHYPPQVALCVSTQGRDPKRHAGRGRFYLAGIVGQLSATYGYPFAGPMALAVRDLMKALQWEQTSPTEGVARIAPALVSPYGIPPGKIQMITTVRVGDVLDTITRRRNDLVESFVSQAIPWTRDA